MGLCGFRSIIYKVISRDQDFGLEPKKFKSFWNECQQELLQLSTNSHYVEIEKSGHYVHKKQPDQIVKALDDRMKEVH